MKINPLMIGTCVLAILGFTGLIAQAQQGSGGHSMCMWEMSHDQCMQMMKKSGASPGMMMRWSMMGAIQVDSYDPSALLAMNTELALTPEQQEKLATIQNEAREKAKAVLTDAQQGQVKPLLDTPSTMKGMCQQWHAKMNKPSGSGSSGCCW